MIEQLFFELIRVAIGSQNTLSKPPSAKEWQLLYDMAKKQSLVGICFAGVQKILSTSPLKGERLNTLEPSEPHETSWNFPEMDYLRWMGMAAKIQQRNEVMKAKGEELFLQLHKAGMDACILKGQALAPYYGSLGHLRQSGDIDVWVKNRSVMELDSYVRVLGLIPHTTAAHVSYEDDGVEVELHAMPGFFRNILTDRKFKKWCNERNNSKHSTLTSNPVNFNLVYLMVHMYHHVLFEGLGLRQLMDYYFVLLATNKTKTHSTSLRAGAKTADSVSYGSVNLVNDNSSSATKSSLDASSIKETASAKNIKNIQADTLKLLKYLKLQKFASGIMWIMKEVFRLEDKYLICEASEKYGRLILEDVMTGGNFGHHDEKNKGLHGGTAIGRSLNGLKRNMKFFALGPAEILCSPIWSTWHWWWRKRRGLL